MNATEYERYNRFQVQSMCNRKKYNRCNQKGILEVLNLSKVEEKESKLGHHTDIKQQTEIKIKV